MSHKLFSVLNNLVAFILFPQHSITFPSHLAFTTTFMYGRTIHPLRPIEKSTFPEKNNSPNLFFMPTIHFPDKHFQRI